MTRLTAVVALLIGAALIPLSAAHADDSVLGNAKKGEKSFTTICAGCHGASGKGDGPAGAALNPKPRNFTDAALMHTLSDEHLINVITNGGASVGKSPFMPAWGAVLKENEVRDVAAYVRAFAPMDAPAEPAEDAK